MDLETLSRPNNTWTRIIYVYAEFKLVITVYQFIKNRLQEILHFLWGMKELGFFLFIDNCAISLCTFLSILTRQRAWMFQWQQGLSFITLHCGLGMKSQKFMGKSSNCNRNKDNRNKSTKINNRNKINTKRTNKLRG